MRSFKFQKNFFFCEDFKETNQFRAVPWMPKCCLRHSARMASIVSNAIRKKKNTKMDPTKSSALLFIIIFLYFLRTILIGVTWANNRWVWGIILGTISYFILRYHHKDRVWKYTSGRCWNFKVKQMRMVRHFDCNDPCY